MTTYHQFHPAGDYGERCGDCGLAAHAIAHHPYLVAAPVRTAAGVVAFDTARFATLADATNHATSLPGSTILDLARNDAA